MKLARRMQKVFIELDNDMVYVNEVQYKQTNGAEGEYRATVRGCCPWFFVPKPSPPVPVAVSRLCCLG